MAYRILVVDDSSPMRAVIIKTIKAAGYAEAEFREAGNGREALEQVRDEWLDIIVTDYNMPDMDGMELLATLKQDNLLSTVPVLVVTTEGSRSRVEEFLEKGAAGYIKKPFTPEEIREQLVLILGEADDAGFEGSDDGFDF